METTIIEEIALLLRKYQKRIAHLQKQSDTYDSLGRGGMCISINGEIQAYNAVISDLKTII